MKIGQLSKKYGLTPNAIRYYIKLGLLIPDGNSQYSFSQRDEEDLKLILHMKDLHYSLKDISTMLMFRRTGNMIEADTISACLDLMQNHRKELLKQIQILRNAVDNVEIDMQTIKYEPRHPKSHTGVPLAALDLLCCPKCGSCFELSDAVLNSKYIFEGRLSCPSGHNLTIKNGIILTGNLYTGDHDWPDLSRGLYRDIGDSAVSRIQKGHDLLTKYFQSGILSGKVILETHLNSYFLMYNHLDLLPENCIYIVTDRFPCMLEMYKELIEQIGISRNILYIADDSMNFPLKSNSIDLLIDSMSSQEYGLYHTDSYIHSVKRFLKKESLVLGMAVVFKGITKSQYLISQKYPEGSQLPFSLDSLEFQYQQAGFQLELSSMGTVDQTNAANKYSFECHIDGDVLHILVLKAVLKP